MVKRQRRKAYTQAARRIATGFASGLYSRYRASGSNTRTRRRSQDSTTGVTNQYDARVIYRRPKVGRRAIKKRLRRRRAFTRQFTNLLGCQQFVKSNSQDITSGLNQQAVTSFCFLGSGIADPHKDFPATRDSLQTSGIAAQWRKNETIYYKAAVCDVTLYNSTVAGTPTADIDVYLFRVRKNCGITTSVDGSFTTALTSEQKPDGTAITTIAASTIGATPFQAPQFCQYFSIIKKTKYLISQGQSVHFQFKQGFKTLNGENTTDAFFFKGMMGVLIIWNGVYQDSVNGYPATRLGVTYQRTYNLKYMAEGDDRLGTF